MIKINKITLGPEHDHLPQHTKRVQTRQHGRLEEKGKRLRDGKE
jgi:hypothetical protein